MSQEVCRDLGRDPVRYQSTAILALQEAAEAFLVRMFSQVNDITIVGKCNRTRGLVTLSRSASTPRLEDIETTIVSLHYWSNTKVATRNQKVPAP